MTDPKAEPVRRYSIPANAENVYEGMRAGGVAIVYASDHDRAIAAKDAQIDIEQARTRVADARADRLAAENAQLTQRLAEAEKDAVRLDGLEACVNTGSCPGIINDDAGRWAVSDDGMQNLPDKDRPIDIQTTFFVTAEKWRNSIREAIDAYLADDNDGDAALARSAEVKS